MGCGAHLLRDEHLLDKELVQPLLRKVDAQLLERVDTQQLEAVQVDDTHRPVTVRLARRRRVAVRHAMVDEFDQIVEEAHVEAARDRVPPPRGQLGRERLVGERAADI